MNATRRSFKQTQLIGWESEPSEQRSSEFVPSTGYSALSGRYTVHEPRHKPKNKGASSLLVVTGLIVSLGAVGMYWLAQLLRG